MFAIYCKWIGSTYCAGREFKVTSLSSAVIHGLELEAAYVVPYDTWKTPYSDIKCKPSVTFAKTI